VSEPRALARELIAREGVVSVALDGPGGVLIETRDPDGLHDALPRLCLERNIRMTHMAATDESLQAVFDYLFERRRGEAS